MIEKITGVDKMVYAVVRIRGNINVRPEIKDTLKMLRLNKVNHCSIIPETNETKGMLRKVKDYVTWGEIDPDSLNQVLATRGRLLGDIPITDKYLKSNSKFKSVSSFASEITSGKAKLTDLKDIKAVIRLHPPRKGYEGIKRPFKLGGALGYRGEKINELLRRMI